MGPVQIKLVHLRPTMFQTLRPFASAVSISGTTQYGHLLTGNYTYSDANADIEGTSTFPLAARRSDYSRDKSDLYDSERRCWDNDPDFRMGHPAAAATGVSPGTRSTKALQRPTTRPMPICSINDYTGRYDAADTWSHWLLHWVWMREAATGST
jgi:hypothetical protein